MTIINTLPFQLQNGTTADATQVMADFDEIVNDVNNNGAHNGVNSDITALTALTTPIPPIGGGSSIFVGGAAGGTANVLTLGSTVPTGFTLTLGNRVVFTPATGNTAAATMAVGATAATAILRPTPSGVLPLIGGELVAGVETEMIYDGTEFVLLTNTAQVGGFGANTALASATVTDLGTIPSHQVAISGTTTITAFGASASVAYPIYQLQFNSILTITYDNVAMLLPGNTSITTQAGDFAIAKYIGAGSGNGNWRILAYYRQNGQPLSLPAVLLQNYIAGLVLSTAGGSGTFGIAAGEATDSTNAVVINFASAFTKTTASWVAGSGNGGLDTGSIAINTWYHVFLIQNPTTGVIDIVFSATATPAAGPTTPPSGFTLFRRIGSMKTDGSSHWTAFFQVGKEFIWNVPVQDINLTNLNGALSTLGSVPPGVIVNAKLLYNYDSSATGSYFVIQSALGSNQVPNTPTGNFLGNASAATSATGFAQIFTNTSAQIRVVGNGVGTIQFYGITTGWIDPLGT